MCVAPWLWTRRPHHSSYLKKDCIGAKPNQLCKTLNFMKNIMYMAQFIDYMSGSRGENYMSTSNASISRSIASHSKHNSRSCSDKAVLFPPKLIGLRLKHSQQLVAQLQSYKNERGVLRENKSKNVSKDYHPAINTKGTAAKFIISAQMIQTLSSTYVIQLVRDGGESTHRPLIQVK